MESFGDRPTYSRKPAWFLVMVVMIVVVIGILTSMAGQETGTSGGNSPFNNTFPPNEQILTPLPSATPLPATPPALQTMAEDEKRLAIERARLELNQQRQQATAQAQNQANAYQSTAIAIEQSRSAIQATLSAQRVEEKRQEQVTHTSFTVLFLAAGLAFSVALLAVRGVIRSGQAAAEAEALRLEQVRKLMAEHNQRVEAACRRSQAAHALALHRMAGSDGSTSTKLWPGKTARDALGEGIEPEKMIIKQ